MRLLRPCRNAQEWFWRKNGRFIDFQAILKQKPLDSAWFVDPTRRLLSSGYALYFCTVYMLCYSSSSKYCIFRLFKSCKSSSHTDQNSTLIRKKIPKSLISSFDQKEKKYNSLQKLRDFLNILKPIEEEIFQFYL